MAIAFSMPLKVVQRMVYKVKIKTISKGIGDPIRIQGFKGSRIQVK